MPRQRSRHVATWIGCTADRKTVKVLGFQNEIWSKGGLNDPGEWLQSSRSLKMENGDSVSPTDEPGVHRVVDFFETRITIDDPTCWR